MIKAWLRRKQIIGQFVYNLGDWSLEHWTDERILKDLNWELESKIREEIRNIVVLEADKHLISKLVSEHLQSMDIAPIIAELAKKRTEEQLAKVMQVGRL